MSASSSLFIYLFINFRMVADSIKIKKKNNSSRGLRAENNVQPIPLLWGCQTKQKDTKL